MEQGLFIGDISEIMGNTRGVSTRRRITRKVTQPKVFDCQACGLDKQCRSPKIKRFGKGEKGVLFVGLCPGRTEDVEGIPFVGWSGDFLRRNCDLVGIGLNQDCVRTNIVACYPGRGANGRDKNPTDDQIRCCSQNLYKDILEVKPKLIVCLGTEAMQAVLKTPAISSPHATQLHGKVFPYHKLNCWVGCSFHPSFFIHRLHDKSEVHDDCIFTYDLASIIGVLDAPLPKPPSKDDNKFISNVDGALMILEEFSNTKNIVGFDYETSCLSPLEKDARILVVSITDSLDYGYCIPIMLRDKFTGKCILKQEDQLRVTEALKNFVASNAPKSVQNYYMEELWSRKILGVSINNFIHDTMISYHVINGRTGLNGLEFQAFELTGHEYKGMIDIKNVEDSSVEDISEYSCFDSRHTVAACHEQLRQLRFEENSRAFNDLFTRSLPTLANLKERGIRIDLKAMDDIESEFTQKADECAKAIRQDEEVRKFERNSSGEFNLNAPVQWGKVLFGGYRINPILTSTGRCSTSDESLKVIYESTENQQVRSLLDSLFKYRRYADVIKKVATAPNTISKKVGEYRRCIYPDGRIHPTFNLHTTPTYRSSTTGPNSQNQYKHDQECRKFRKCIVPDEGHLLLEVDGKGMELRQIAMTSGDQELIRQIEAGINIHIKWAAEIYEKSMESVTKDEKWTGKNGFVFPTVFGSLPPAISKHIGKPKEFIQKLQDKFWVEFKGIRDWHKDLIKFYNENGYIEGLSGFKCHGPLTIYQVCNYPISGPAFHLILDALNRIDEYLVKHNFRSRIINEIHDALVFSAHPDEIEEVMKIATDIIISKRFQWQTVPLELSWEIGENGYNMQEV